MNRIDPLVRERNRYRRPLVSMRSTSVNTGLFETAADVDNCIARVDAQINSLDRDMTTEFIKRYGPQMFAASITAAQLETFRADRTFYQSWLGFRQSWDTFRSNWQNRTVSVLSADRFRDCQSFDLEQKQWQQKWIARGGKVTAPATTTPSAIPGIIPPKSQGSEGFPWFTVIVIGSLGAAAYYFYTKSKHPTYVLPPPAATVSEAK